MTHKRLLVAVVLLAASGVLAQTAEQTYLRKDSSSHHTVLSYKGGAEVDLENLFDPPKPEWVPDPSAGHYDCPDGWTAYKRGEPSVFKVGGYSVPAIYRSPTLDKKGHVLEEQPSPAICIQEKP